MKPVEALQVAGFRGILAEVGLSFVKGGRPESAIVYGGNGTGKSSLTDALEWLQTGSIARLRHEGARERSYANRAADFDPYVRLKLRDSSLGAAGLVYSRARVTIPTEEGAIEEVRAMAPHPWQIRNEDLASFVTMTKAQRFDALAGLMGFVPQVEFQKQLRRVGGMLSRRRDEAWSVHADAVRQLEQLVNAPNTSDSGVLGAVNRVLSELDRRIETLDEAPAMRDRLGSEIESDPRAAQLARLKSFASVVTRPSNVDALTRACQGLLEALKELRVQLTGAVALARLDILEAALRHFGDETRGPVDLCPLCGQRFVGDLRQHVAEELERLERLRSLQQLVKTQQRASRGEIDKVLAVGVADLARSSEADSLGLGTPFEALSEGLAQLADALDRTRVLSQKAPEKWGDEDVLRMAELLAEAAAMSARASELRASLATAIEERSVELDDRGVRTCMVRARDLIRDILDTQGRIDLSKRRADGLATLCEVYDRVADEYVAASNADVERRFSAISTDVDRYFSVLEAGTPGLAGPALRLVQDRDRAVILEIEFRGERIDHAHGYLSQSQLNSFGLAVFLASARIANNTFPFLVLDDVINSFDAYKRPRLAELLRTDFSDFQLLVLTHDHLWWDRLARECPSWVRLRFTRYEPGSGPIYKEGVSSVEEIGAFIDEDRPDLAGRSLGPLMELELQELAEAFEALVPYNRRNEYTLDPLLDRLRVRAKEKLGASHPFHVALSQMQEATSFRNFAAHWKNPESPITAPEMREVFDRWGDIRSMARCPESGCGLLAYDRNSGSFICSCRKTALVRHT